MKVKQASLKFKSNIQAIKHASNVIDSGDVDLLSLDVFDTLLNRTVAPDYILEGASRIISESEEVLNTSASEVLSAYHRAYADNVHRNVKRDLDDEILAGDFYLHWAQLIAPHADQGSLEVLVSKMMAALLELEKSFCRANGDFLRFVRSYKNKISVIFVSDMYMTREMIFELLDTLGYEDCFQRGYSSCDYGLLKRTGNLFERVVLPKEAMAPNRVLHIGDNLLSDYESPRRIGIKAIGIQDRDVQKSLRSNQFELNQLTADRGYAGSFVANSSRRSGYGERIEQYGYARLGPIFSSFIHGVCERVAQYDLDHVYFLSREGHILNRLYQLIAPTLPLSLPDSSYLYSSRKAALQLSTQSVSLREIALTAANGDLSIKNLLAPYDLAGTKVSEVAARYGISDIEAALPHDYLSWPPFLNFLSDPELNGLIEETVSESRDAYVEYLHSEGFFDHKKVAIVDVGWSAQIQESLYLGIKDVPGAPAICGIYMGTSVTAHRRKTPENWVEWIIGDECHLDWRGLSVFEFPQLMEFVTRAPHGTVTGFGFESKNSVPVLKSMDSPSRVSEDKSDPILSLLQNGVVDYCSHYATCLRASQFTFADSVHYALDNLANLIRFPSRFESFLFLRLSNVSDLGSDRQHVMGDIVPLRYALFPRHVRRYAQVSFWKAATINARFVGRIYQMLYAILYGVARTPVRGAVLDAGVVFHAPGTVFRRKEERSQADSRPLGSGRQVHGVDELFECSLARGRRADSMCDFSEFDPRFGFRGYILNGLAFRLINLLAAFKGRYTYSRDGVRLRMLVRKSLIVNTPGIAKFLINCRNNFSAIGFARSVRKESAEY